MKYRRISNKKFLYITYGILAILLVALGIILYLWYSKRMAGFSPEVETHQFVNGVEIDYSADATFYDSEDTILIKVGDSKEEITRVPLLYAGSTKMALTKDMIFMDTESGAGARRLVRFTTLTPAGETVTLEYQDKSAITFGGFLYDGDNTYIFLSDTTITYGEEEFTLPALSYIDTGSDGLVTYYDSEAGQVTELNIVGVALEATAETYHLNLSCDSMYQGDTEYLLLTSVDSVKDLEME